MCLPHPSTGPEAELEWGASRVFPRGRFAVPLLIPIPEGNEELDVFLQQHPEGWEGAGVSWYHTTKIPFPRAQAPRPALPKSFPASPGHPKDAKVNPPSCLLQEHSSPYCLHMGSAGELPPSLGNEAFPANPKTPAFITTISILRQHWESFQESGRAHPHSRPRKINHFLWQREFP